MAIPNVDFVVFENSFELVVDLLAGYAFLEDDLQEAAAACAADHATVDELLNGGENLVDERIRAASIDFLRKLPMEIEQLCKLVDAAAFEFETHEGGDSLDFVEGVERIGLVADISSDNIPQEVSGQSSLPCIDERKALIQFIFRGLWKDDMLDLDLLFKSRQ